MNFQSIECEYGREVLHNIYDNIYDVMIQVQQEMKVSQLDELGLYFCPCGAPEELSIRIARSAAHKLKHYHQFVNAEEFFLTELLIHAVNVLSISTIKYPTGIDYFDCLENYLEFCLSDTTYSFMEEDNYGFL